MITRTVPELNDMNPGGRYRVFYSPQRLRERQDVEWAYEGDYQGRGPDAEVILHNTVGINLASNSRHDAGKVRIPFSDLLDEVEAVESED